MLNNDLKDRNNVTLCNNQSYKKGNVEFNIDLIF